MNDAREAAPATRARPPAAHSPWRLGWHTGYYVLVVLNLATLSLGLFQNHRILTRNKQSAVFNQQWAERIDSYGALARLAAAANAPGNDVFATKDVEGEARGDQEPPHQRGGDRRSRESASQYGAQ